MNKLATLLVLLSLFTISAVGCGGSGAPSPEEDEKVLGQEGPPAGVDPDNPDAGPEGSPPGGPDGAPEGTPPGGAPGTPPGGEPLP